MSELTKDDYRIAENFYENGSFVEAFVKYKALAENGDIDCQTFVGWMYEQGEGVSKCLDSAFYWYKKAALSGSAEAQFLLAKLHAQRKQYSEAFKLYQKAVEQNYSPALFRLGWIYETGRGVGVDMEKAFLYYEKAGKLGNIFGLKSSGLMLIKGYQGLFSRIKGIYLFIMSLITAVIIVMKDPKSEKLRD